MVNCKTLVTFAVIDVYMLINLYTSTLLQLVLVFKNYLPYILKMLAAAVEKFPKEEHAGQVSKFPLVHSRSHTRKYVQKKIKLFMLNLCWRKGHIEPCIIITVSVIF